MASEFDYMQVPAFYDLFARGNKIVSRKINFFKKLSKDFDNIVELGAGTGQLAIAIAASGKKVIHCNIMYHRMGDRWL